MAAKKLKTTSEPAAPSSNWKALQKTLPPPSIYTKKRKRDVEVAETKPAAPALDPTSAAAGTSTDAGRFVALDCEFVGVGVAGVESMLARVSLVNFHGHTLLDTFVKPKERVTDYRTWVSGVTEADLNGEGSAPVASFEEVQKQTADLLNGRILVGHAIQNDLKCLLLSHPKASIRDTSKYEPLRELAKTKRPALRKLAQLVLGVQIQADLDAGHSSVEDAKATMAIYRAHKTAWEASLTTGRPLKKAKARPEPRSEGHERYKQKQTLGLAATLNHARHEADAVPSYTSETVSKSAPTAKARDKPAKAAGVGGKRAASSSKSVGKANDSEWWKAPL